MATLIEDIKTQSQWIITAFALDGLKLDYSIHSFIEIDKFFDKHSKNGKAVKGGRLSQNLGTIIFSLGSYVGQTIIQTIPGSAWHTDDNDQQGEIGACISLPNGTIIFPIQRIMKRFENGLEDSVYAYGHHFAKDYSNEPFDQSFWEIGKEKDNQAIKPWWKIW